ncbi:D-hexose-6-phosphate mutarotase [Pseudomonas aeruginosa]|uniref:D-hexose-6-phosphate mutarotase n=1 Tax=Pseudomonas aeruginosa TaxID=287 RepID=UPI0026ECFAF8|nr:D-hexose-6-phosphate mutarotase [Pseudomonas aeruginosa]
MATIDIQRQQRDELTCWFIRNGAAELLVAEQGAQVLRYRRTERPIVWLSEQAAFARGQSLRGGVPLCWPWFGDLARNPAPVRELWQGEGAAPFHGLVRGIDWQLQDIVEADASVSLVFSLQAPAVPLADCPAAPHVEFALALGDEALQLTLDNHNAGAHPLAFSQALHSYYAVSDVRQVRVEGVQGCRYHDALQDWRPCRQDAAPVIEAETDRVYLDVPARLAIEDPGWQRRIVLDSQGSTSAVLWNPWIDKARRLSQFAGDAWQRMLCVETGNLLEDAPRLAPGQSHRLSLRIHEQAL